MYINFILWVILCFFYCFLIFNKLCNWLKTKKRFKSINFLTIRNVEISNLTFFVNDFNYSHSLNFYFNNNNIMNSNSEISNVLNNIIDYFNKTFNFFNNFVNKRIQNYVKKNLSNLNTFLVRSFSLIKSKT